MAIVVVCPGCRARFQVSEKFAGKQGPCPKCKNLITIPALADEVKVHEPEQFAAGGTDTKGRPVLKPLARTETKLNAVMVVGIVGAALVVAVIAFFLRGLDPQVQTIVLGAGAGALAPPLVLGGYSFLRNQELEPYRGMSLLIRVAICSLVYAALWGAIYAAKMFLMSDQSSLTAAWTWLVLLGPPAMIGALTALATLDLDFGSGFFHYCLYMVACILLRMAMGLSAL